MAISLDDILDASLVPALNARRSMPWAHHDRSAARTRAPERIPGLDADEED
jgi:hypothetical protein